MVTPRGRLDDPGPWPERSSLCRGHLPHSPTARGVRLTGVGRSLTSRALEIRTALGAGTRHGQTGERGATRPVVSAHVRRRRWSCIGIVIRRVMPPWLAPRCSRAPAATVRVAIDSRYERTRDVERGRARSDRRLLRPDRSQAAPECGRGSRPAQPTRRGGWPHECDPTRIGQRGASAEDRRRGATCRRGLDTHCAHSMVASTRRPAQADAPTAPDGVIGRHHSTLVGSLPITPETERNHAKGCWPRHLPTEDSRLRS